MRGTTIDIARRRIVRRMSNERGMAMMTVLVFGFIFIVGTLAFFKVAGFEAGRTQIAQNSTRAFYLADGAIEKAKKEVLIDGRWRVGFPMTSEDGGSYRMQVSDTLFEGSTRTRFYAEGFWGRNKRDVEVVANIRPAGLGVAIHASGNIDLRGNICLDGFAHANGTIINPDKFRCGSTRVNTYDSGTHVDPPPVYTEPDSFPGATYYHVTVTKGQGAQKDTLWIQDRNRAPISFWIHPAAPHADMTWSYNSGARRLDIEFKPTNSLDQVSGAFPRLGSDFTVVVNFAGRKQTSPPKIDHVTSNVTIQETGTPPYAIQTTLINARFEGATTADRLDRNKWEGGNVECKTKARFEPLYCIAMITRTVSGNAQAELGTANRPALTYVMENVDFSTGQWSIYGTLISLGDIQVGGGVNLTFDPRFISCLPPSIGTNWPAGTSGSMQILAWREPPTRNP